MSRVMCVAFAVCAIKKLEDCSVKCWNRIALCPISLIPPALAIGVLSLLMEFVIVAEGCPNESVTWGGAEWHSVTFLFWFGHFKTFLNSDKTFVYRHNYEKLLVVLLKKTIESIYGVYCNLCYMTSWICVAVTTVLLEVSSYLLYDVKTCSCPSAPMFRFRFHWICPLICV